MEHTYMLFKRGDRYGNGAAMVMPEQAITTLLYHREIEHEKTSHVGSDKSMTHYFIFKERR